jgi:phage gp45-like
MSAFGSLLEVLTVKRTELIGKLGTIVSVFAETPEKDPDDPSGVVADEISEPSEWWQHYGFVSRPPDGAEYLTLRVGATIVAFASRALAFADAYGKLGKGDVGLYSVGKNTLRLAAGGSISMLVPDARGKQIVFRIDPQGSFKVMLGNGFFLELSEENGFAVSTPDKNVNLAGKDIIVTGNSLINNSGVLQTTRTAGLPLATGPITKPNPGLLI